MSQKEIWEWGKWKHKWEGQSCHLVLLSVARLLVEVSRKGEELSLALDPAFSHACPGVPCLLCQWKMGRLCCPAWNKSWHLRAECDHLSLIPGEALTAGAAGCMPLHPLLLNFFAYGLWLETLLSRVQHGGPAPPRQPIVTRQ